MQLKKFRGTADRLPEPFRPMLTGAASDFYRAVLDFGIEPADRRLSRAGGDLLPAIDARPLSFRQRRGERDRPRRIGRLFGPNGILDSFFKQSLAKYVDTAKTPWSFRPEYPLTARLSAASLREFQRAAQIRDLSPSAARPSALTGIAAAEVAGCTAKFEVNGQEAGSVAGTSVTPRAIQWPGGGGGRRRRSASPPISRPSPDRRGGRLGAGGGAHSA